MLPEEDSFKNELEIFRNEVEAGVQFLYAHLGMQASLINDAGLLDRVNQNALFWKTVDGAFHTATFMTLGRIFDQKSSHNIDKLIGISQKNQQIFSVASLSERKRGCSKNADEWLPTYLVSVYVPNDSDFRSIRKIIKEKRNIYRMRYGTIRDKIYAHAELATLVEKKSSYQNTLIVELCDIFCSLHNIYVNLWELYSNGRKPCFSYNSYSAMEIVRSGSVASLSLPLAETIVLETKAVLSSIES